MATVLLGIGAVNRKLPPIVYPSGVRSQLVLTSLPISRNSGLVARARGVSLFEFGQRKTAAIESRPVFVARPHSDVNVLEDFPRSDAAGGGGRVGAGGASPARGVFAPTNSGGRGAPGGLCTG